MNQKVTAASGSARFVGSAYVRLFIDVTDIEDRPEIEAIRDMNIPLQEKLEKLDAIKDGILREVAWDKWVGISIKAERLGAKIDFELGNPEHNNIDWESLVRTIEDE